MLELELDRIDKQLPVTSCDALSAERKVLKAKLDEQYKVKAKGYQIRSRAKWVELGEQSTRYFLGLEKSRQNQNCICSLTDRNGKITKFLMWLQSFILTCMQIDHQVN